MGRNFRQQTCKPKKSGWKQVDFDFFGSKDLSDNTTLRKICSIFSKSRGRGWTHIVKKQPLKDVSKLRGVSSEVIDVHYSYHISFFSDSRSDPISFRENGPVSRATGMLGNGCGRF